MLAKYLQNLETATIKIAVELGIFKLMADAAGPLSADEIAKSTNADPVLMGNLFISLTTDIELCSQILRTNHALPRGIGSRKRSRHNWIRTNNGEHHIRQPTQRSRPRNMFRPPRHRLSDIPSTSQRSEIRGSYRWQRYSYSKSEKSNGESPV